MYIVIWWPIWIGLVDSHTSHAKKFMKVDDIWHYCNYSQENTWSWDVSCLCTSVDCHCSARLQKAEKHHGKDSTAAAHVVRVLWINKQFHSPGLSPSGTYHQNEIHLRKKKKGNCLLLMIAQLHLFIQCPTKQLRVT